MGRTWVRFPVAAILVSVALVAAGCGGDGESALGRREFRTEANDQCRKLQRAGNVLGELTLDPTITGRAVTRRLVGAVGILRARLRAIDALVAPDAEADDVERLISTLERYADQLDALGERARPDDSFLALQQHNPKRVERLNQLTNEANALAATLHLEECISGTP